MSKKILFFISLAVFLAVGGLGCKGLSKQQQAATQPITLEYWTVFDDVDALQTQIDKYKADRPYLTINLKQLRVDELYPRLLEALAEDRGPDIISVRNKWISFYKPKLATMPASVSDTTVRTEKTAVGSKTTVSGSTQNLPSITQIEKEYVQAVKKDVVMDGNIYGLPLSLENMAIYYNKDLLDRAGIAEAPKNWKEFQAAVEKLVKIDKASGKILQSGTALGTGNNISGFEDILYILFKQSGIDLINKDGAVNFNNTSGNINNDAIAVLNFYTDFANQTRSTYSWNEDMEMALDRFINGSVAFFFGYSYHAPVIQARSPQLNVAVLPMLQLNPEEPINVANYWIQSVTEKSKHKNEAWGLVNYLTHSGATKEYIEKSGRPSALRAYVAKQLDDPNLQPFVSQALVSDSWYHGNDYETTVRAMADMVHQWLLPAPQVGREQEWKKEIINRAAAKISQTL